MQLSRVQNSTSRVFDCICLWVLPAGFFLLLSALFFLPDRSLHHKVYYALFSIPTLLALCIKPAELKSVGREPLVLLFVLFAGFAILSLNWSDTSESTMKLIKPPLHTFMLFAGLCLLLRHRFEGLQPILLSAALVALAASTLDLCSYINNPPAEERLVGSGALDNPLLSSHLFGFFATYWLFIVMTSRKLPTRIFALGAFAVMFATVLATGSRTPLIAMCLAATWIAILRRDRRAWVLLCALPVAAIALTLLAPELLFGRGFSSRLTIWQITLDFIAQRPWLGHGYDATLVINPMPFYYFSEPHSFALGVLYYVGIVGFVAWAGMIGYGLYSGWRHRTQPLYVLASALLMFGLGAGLTEGGGLLSRPKEHWFLLWIPLALIAALNVALRTRRLPLQPVCELRQDQAVALISNAEIIEEDGLGAKVLRLEDGSFLKLFRPRRWYTSGSFNPYSQRFARNSQQLTTLGFTTPRILDLYQYADGSTGVRYEPLPGRTLRQALAASPDLEAQGALVRQFGRYLGQLHERGVYFRSLHLGNVLLLDDGALGLIDLADMRLLPGALSLSLRQRNLRHMQRYEQDRGWLFETHVSQLLAGYAEVAGASAVERIRNNVTSPAS